MHLGDPLKHPPTQTPPFTPKPLLLAASTEAGAGSRREQPNLSFSTNPELPEVYGWKKKHSEPVISQDYKTRVCL